MSDSDGENNQNEFDGEGGPSKYFPEVNENIEEIKHSNEGGNHEEYASLFQENFGTEPKDGEDPNIYSMVEPVSPYSFVDGRQDFDNRSPPCTYLKYEDVNLKLPIEKEDIFEKFQFGEKGGLRCIDEEAMERQKGVLKDVVKEFAKNFFKGLGISHMSLPVRMFEPRSTIQRVADYFGFAPIFLKKAAGLTDKVERFKCVVSYAIAGMQVGSGQLKPFNPILGETLQSKLPDGSDVYGEHISHHPPITAYGLEDVDKEYTFWGSAELTASLSANSMKAGQEGDNYV